MQLRNGFTLVELIVATALFATVVTVAVNIFVLTLRQPLKQIDNQHGQEELNYLFTLVAYQMNTLHIDYKRYGAITNPVAQLYLTNAADEELTIYLNHGQVLLANETLATEYPITTLVRGDVVMDTLEFYIYPLADPSDPADEIDYQPAVVMHAAGHSTANAAATFNAQTFLTSRQYVR